MNWKLIGMLSLFGLIMAGGTIGVISAEAEPLFWLPILLASGIILGRRTTRPFVHGVLVGLANAVWMTAAHIAFVNPFLANHAREAAMMATMPFPTHPRLLMLVVGPVVGLLSGALIGVIASITAVLSKRPKPAPVSPGT